MTYTANTIEAFSRWALDTGRADFSQPAPKAFTLSAAAELACRRRTMVKSRARDLIDSWASDHEELSHAHRLLESSAGCAVSRSRDAVWISLPTPESTASNAHALFLREFTEALKSAKFSTDLAYALAGAVEGMTDNLVQHCFDSAHSRGGFAAFRIRTRGMAFVVADLGRGALNSLRENAAWKHLDTDHAAIRAIVTQHASRRAGLGEGEGFKTLFKSLASLNGELRFRSGVATYTIEGTLDAVHGIAGFSDSIPGLFLGVRCRLS